MDPPVYVSTSSNHPAHILKTLPKSISKRLSTLSSTETQFKESLPIYENALKLAGYKNAKLKYECNSAKDTEDNRVGDLGTWREDTGANRSRNNCRRGGKKQRVIWFNPPFSKGVETNMTKAFTSILQQCFPKTSGYLYTRYNPRRVKLSYSCCPNMGQILAGITKRRMTEYLKEEKKKAGRARTLQPDQPEKECNCIEKADCPLRGKCMTGEGCVYKAEVESEGVTREYIGCTENDFKTRWYLHRRSFKQRSENQTTLSRYIWELKDKNTNYNIKWSILARAAPYFTISRLLSALHSGTDVYNFGGPERQFAKQQRRVFLAVLAQGEENVELERGGRLACCCC